MPLSVALYVVLFTIPLAELPTAFRQVVPGPKWLAGNLAGREKDRAVVIVHGLRLQPFHPDRVRHPEFRDFQEPNSQLVRVLSKDSAVFAFAYAQTAPVETIAQSPGLRLSVAQLKRAGYREIVLLGHSAGGVIARLFTEAYPDSGVTKVVTVASPHAGNVLAKLSAGCPRAQVPFVQSLSIEARTKLPHPKLDDRIQMACVVCKLKVGEGDGLVALASQWPEDCRKQGVPAVLVYSDHWHAMLSEEPVGKIAELVREPLTRWSAEEVQKAERVLFRDPEEKPFLFKKR